MFMSWFIFVRKLSHEWIYGFMVRHGIVSHYWYHTNLYRVRRRHTHKYFEFKKSNYSSWKVKRKMLPVASSACFHPCYPFAMQQNIFLRSLYFHYDMSNGSEWEKMIYICGNYETKTNANMRMRPDANINQVRKKNSIWLFRTYNLAKFFFLLSKWKQATLISQHNVNFNKVICRRVAFSIKWCNISG